MVSHISAPGNQTYQLHSNKQPAQTHVSHNRAICLDSTGGLFQVESTFSSFTEKRTYLKRERHAFRAWVKMHIKIFMYVPIYTYTSNIEQRFINAYQDHYIIHRLITFCWFLVHVLFTKYWKVLWTLLYCNIIYTYTYSTVKRDIY